MENVPPPDKHVRSLSAENVPPPELEVNSLNKITKSLPHMTKKKKPMLKTKKKKGKNFENVWKAPPKIQVDLLQRARAISNQGQEHGLMFNLEEVRQDQKKGTVSVFVMDKRSRKIVKPTKDMVTHQLSSMGVKVLLTLFGMYWCRLRKKPSP